MTNLLLLGSLLFLLSRVLPVTSVLIVHEGGSCGYNSIPSRMTVDKEGRPEVSCDKPSCLNSKAGVVHCDSYKETVCAEDSQYTAGLIEINNGTHRTLKTECCSNDQMIHAEAIKSIFMGPGETYTGGYVEKDGRVEGFDLIKEVRKTVNVENEVQYILAIYRIPCGMDSSEQEDVVARFSRNKRRLRFYPDAAFDDGIGRRRAYSARGRSAFRSARRRPSSLRRRAMFRHNDDYYDYDYDYPVMRRPMYRRNRVRSEDRLWPVYYPKARALSANTQIDENKIADELTSLPAPEIRPEARSASTYAENAEVSLSAPGPIPPPDSNFIDTEVAPAVDNYAAGKAQLPVVVESYASQPVAPPSLNSFGNLNNQPSLLQASYPSYPSYSYPASYPSYPSYSYPSYYTPPNLNAMLGGGNSPFTCFSGDMEVETDRGSKLIKDLKVGDMVLSMDESMVTFAPIIMFLHNVSDQVADFNHIETAGGDSLKLTDEHLIYISECAPNKEMKMKSAKDVKVGDCVHIASKENTIRRHRVESVKKVRQIGIYSPLTSTGDIIVNRFLTSCHSNVALKTLQQTFFTVYKKTTVWWKNLFISNLMDEETDLPYGVESLTSVLDLFIPNSLL
ncbi:unnamed protein product [Caenorhabditis auriculariae]|uniref:Warthog protein 6 n=1 Tax=Caenorhabditis auriculariae TaxID=2777116 RepID=A0A8S1H529_9PELO|nr:unnamed protein product [Caenorhabditis auriculariae]